MRVHQITAGLAYGDAISNHIVEIDRRLKQWGIESHIYAENVDPRMAHLGSLDYKYVPFMENTEDLLIYHYSIYSSTMKFYLESRNRKVVDYHNITLPHFFHGYDASLAQACRLGRSLLPKFQDCEMILADSEFNRQELVAAGIPAGRTKVLPIFLRLDDFASVKRNETLYRRLKADGTANILFVGRVTPNKAFEDLLKVFAIYHRDVNSYSRLILVGARSLPRYNQVLDALLARLGLEDAVVFTGHVTFRDLKTYYEAADLFLCTSHHEGFCVPLLEAMYFDLPVLARAETSVPYTLGNAGVMYHKLDHAILAEMVQLLLEDPDLRTQVLAGQRRRLEAFAPECVELLLRDILRDIGISVRE
ncbi:MAG: glycosyltransferase [Anaerolineae bacterium]|nr:glycosyltransferase [Anaerolineae bacterium]